MAPRDRLLAEAARFLATLLGTCPGEVVVTVRSAELQDGYTLRGPPPANAADSPPATDGYPPGVRWLSPFAESILAVMPPGVLMSAAKIAKLLHPQASTDQDLYACLRDLRDRGFVEGDTHGWRRLF
jgi:hypothetical protein